VYLQVKKTKKTSKKKNKKNFFAVLFSVLLLGLYGYYICTYNFINYVRPLYLNRFLNRNLTFDVNEYIQPTSQYIYNSNLLGANLRVNNNLDSKRLVEVKILNEMTSTKNKILKLIQKYPDLEPSIFMWEYSTSSGFEINSDKLYPSASIIKVPILCELIRLIDYSNKTNKPIKLEDERKFSEFFRTSGSGDLQKTKADKDYSIDYLANIMIANSDNSATNMLLYEIGGIDNFNRLMRNSGLKKISMSNWLPDLEGTNKVSAYEISKLLYNIDNPNYINPKYKNVIKEYLGNTKNTHLLKELLPGDVMVLHKTGDIESMLGDSGIVYANHGKKYIITILVKRPKNSPAAKLLIQEASKIIFEDIKNLD
jgi:beta-lactamase class A